MTKKEFEDIAATLNVLYDDGKLMFEQGDLAKMRAWYSCVSDMDYKGACLAVKNLACKQPYKPKISDLRREYALITQKPALDEQQAWVIVREAIRNGTYGAVEEFEKLPQEIKAAVVDPTMLWEWGQCKSSEVDTVIQSLFKKRYESVIAQKQEDAILGLIGAQRGALAIEAEEQERLEVHDD